MRRRHPLLAVIGTVTLAACLGDGGPVTQPVVPQTNARFVHALSDVGDLNVLVNGIPAFRLVPYGSVSPAGGGWTSIDARPEIILSPVAGSDAFYRDQYPLVFDSTRRWTFLALGDARAATRTDTLLAFRDTTAAPVGTAWIRVVNALDYLATPGDSVDIYTYPSANPRPSGPDIPGLPRLAGTRYLVRSPGTWRVDVLARGASSTTTPLFSTTITLGEGSVRTMVLRDPPATAAAGTQGAVLVLTDRN